MTLYLLQVSYTPEAWATFKQNPQNRLQGAVQPLMGQLGGRMIDAWFGFGEYDAFVVSEVPDSASAAAFASGGAGKSLLTTQLMSVDEGVQAMTKAGSLSYSSPSP